MKHITSGLDYGSMEAIDTIKKATLYLEGWDIFALLDLWEAYVLANSSEAILKIKSLKDYNFYCIICGYEYDQFLEVVTKILGISLSSGTMLEYNKNICNGEVSIPSYFFDPDSHECQPYNVSHIITHSASDDAIFIVTQENIPHELYRGFQHISNLDSLILY